MKIPLKFNENTISLIVLLIFICIMARSVFFKTGSIPLFKYSYFGIPLFLSALIVLLKLKKYKKDIPQESDPYFASGAKYAFFLRDAHRLKENPKIQMLLQYPSVQKAFLDPNYLKTKEAQSDFYIQELFKVMDELMMSGNIF